MFILTNLKYFYPPMAVKVLINKPSLTCSRGLLRTKAIVTNKRRISAEKVNFNSPHYSRDGGICKAIYSSRAVSASGFGSP